MHQFSIAGRIVPKARPRLAGKHAYLPKRYRDWKDAAIVSLKQQLPSDWVPPFPASVQILLMGTQRGDADNVAGAVLDALVQAGVLGDDRLSHVAALSIQHQRDSQYQGVQIAIAASIAVLHRNAAVVQSPFKT